MAAEWLLDFPSSNESTLKVYSTCIIIHGRVKSAKSFSDREKGEMIAMEECHDLFSSCLTIYDHAMQQVYFKILLPLNIGENKYSFQLMCGDLVTSFKMVPIERADPRRADCIVRLVYVRPSDIEGESFQTLSNEPNDLQTAQNKISTSAKLIQASLLLITDPMQTFVLEHDESTNDVPVHVVRSSKTFSQLSKMEGNELHSFLGDEIPQRISQQLGKQHAKYILIMSFTRFMPPNHLSVQDIRNNQYRYLTGHTALGGGDIALFGSGSLFVFPSSFNELSESIHDYRPVEREMFDDSNRRSMRFAAFSTSAGAILHELLHTFDLPHTPSGVMARDFDYFSRAFALEEKQLLNLNRPELLTIEQTKRFFLHKISNLQLQYSCRWLYPNHVPENAKDNVTYKVLNARNSQLVGAGPGAPSNVRNFIETNEQKEKIIGIRVYYGMYLHGLQLIYEKRIGSVLGLASGSQFLFKLDHDEEILEIIVRAGAWIDGIGFKTNKKTSQFNGGSGGTEYKISGSENSRISGLFGTFSDQVIVSIGAIFSDSNGPHSAPSIKILSETVPIHAIFVEKPDNFEGCLNYFLDFSSSEEKIFQYTFEVQDLCKLVGRNPFPNLKIMTLTSKITSFTISQKDIDQWLK